MTFGVDEHTPSAVNLCAEVDLEVLGVVKDVQEGAALIKLGDAEETQSKVREEPEKSHLELGGAPPPPSKSHQPQQKLVPACSGLHGDTNR